MGAAIRRWLCRGKGVWAIGLGLGRGGGINREEGEEKARVGDEEECPWAHSAGYHPPEFIPSGVIGGGEGDGGGGGGGVSEGDRHSSPHIDQPRPLQLVPGSRRDAEAGGREEGWLLKIVDYTVAQPELQGDFGESKGIGSSSGGGGGSGTGSGNIRGGNTLSGGNTSSNISSGNNINNINSNNMNNQNNNINTTNITTNATNTNPNTTTNTISNSLRTPPSQSLTAASHSNYLSGGATASTASIGTTGAGLIVRQLTVTVYRGQNLLITGPSGCGKTSLLRSIAGLWEAEAGTVELDPRVEASRLAQEEGRWRPGGRSSGEGDRGAQGGGGAQGPQGARGVQLYRDRLTPGEDVENGEGRAGMEAGGEGGVVFVPQRPYCFRGTLFDQVTYPSRSDQASASTVRAILSDLGLSHLLTVDNGTGNTNSNGSGNVGGNGGGNGEGSGNASGNYGGTGNCRGSISGNGNAAGGNTVDNLIYMEEGDVKGETDQTTTATPAANTAVAAATTEGTAAGTTTATDARRSPVVFPTQTDYAAAEEDVDGTLPLLDSAGVGSGGDSGHRLCTRNEDDGKSAATFSPPPRIERLRVGRVGGDDAAPSITTATTISATTTTTVAPSTAAEGRTGTGRMRRTGRGAEDLQKQRDWASILSIGEQQRLGIARVLYHRPALAFLDECTSAVTEEAEKHAYELMKAVGVTVVAVGHRTSLRALHERELSLGGAPEGGWEVARLSP